MELRDLDNTIGELEKNLKEKSEKEELIWIKQQYKGPDEVISSDLYRQLAAKEKAPYKCFSGLPTFDKIVDGFRPGNLVIVSGPTKQGKTTFCQTLTYNLDSKGFKALWFSFDTPPVELIERFPEKKRPQFYLPKRVEIDKKIKWIEEKIIEAIAKYRIKIVFIDHLESLARFTNSAPNYAGELQGIVRELKEMAIRWNIIIFLNHHIRQIDDNQAPNWTHLKNSTGPAQESDLTIMVWRDRIKAPFGEILYANTGTVSIQLNRRGRTGNLKVAWVDNLFEEVKKDTDESKF